MPDIEQTRASGTAPPTTMWAVISDIHGNLEALDAVLADIARHPVTAIYCLGDIVGYGPNPVECLEHALKWNVTIMGNHDQAMMIDPGDLCRGAERAMVWTRRTLESSGRDDLRTFLAERPHTHREGSFLFVHGSPRNPVHEYLLPLDIANTAKMTKNALLVSRYCFCGHTHFPGVFVPPERPGEPWQFLTPDRFNHVWHLDARKTIVNVGAVGQPRDDNWRACYVLIDGQDVTYRRVEYDVNATVEKIYAIPDLAYDTGSRLREGR